MKTKLNTSYYYVSSTDIGARSIKHVVEREIASQLALADERGLLKRGGCYRLVLEQPPSNKATAPNEQQAQPSCAPSRRIALMVVREPRDGKGPKLLEPVFVPEHAKKL